MESYRKHLWRFNCKGGIINHTINASVKTAEAITKGAVCLHNFLRLTNSAVYCPNGFVDSGDASGKIKKENGMV